MVIGEGQIHHRANRDLITNSDVNTVDNGVCDNDRVRPRRLGNWNKVNRGRRDLRAIGQSEFIVDSGSCPNIGLNPRGEGKN